MYEKAARKHVGGFFVGAAALSILPRAKIPFCSHAIIDIRRNFR
jgi:hypothetical protein